MEKIYLSVIIPAYNEEKRISRTLLDIDSYLAQQDYSYEIIVVNDGSKDKTVQIVNKLASEIFNKNETIQIGSVYFNKHGYYKKKFFGGEDWVTDEKDVERLLEMGWEIHEDAWSWTT